MIFENEEVKKEFFEMFEENYPSFWGIYLLSFILKKNGFLQNNEDKEI